MTRYMEPLPGHYASDDPFGNIRSNGRPHLGSDYNGVLAGTWFHVVADGQVVVNQWSSVLGWVLGIRHADGKFFGYAHQRVRSPLGVGTWVTIGQGGGEVGDTGSASNGAHLHISCGNTSNAVFGVGVEDPHAYIVARLTDTAGDSGTPFPNTPEELIIPEGYEEMAEPIYARGDTLDRWYALYLNAEQSDTNKIKGSGAVYSGRRSVSDGERAIVTAIGFPHPKQSAVVTIPQATFDSINKLWGSA